LAGSVGSFDLPWRLHGIAEIYKFQDGIQMEMLLFFLATFLFRSVAPHTPEGVSTFHRWIYLGGVVAVLVLVH